MVNEVTLIGRLGKDAEIKNLESGNKVAKFSVATSESYKDKSGEWQEKTTWIDVVCWNQLADRADKLGKGDIVYISGKISVREYEDKNNNKRRIWEVVANRMRTIQKAHSEKTEPVYNTGADDYPPDDLPF